MAVAPESGGVELLLVQDDGAKGSNRVKGEGFSLQITTVQDIDELAARIKARGGVLETEPIAVAGKRGFRLRDPDRIPLRDLLAARSLRNRVRRNACGHMGA